MCVCVCAPDCVRSLLCASLCLWWGTLEGCVLAMNACMCVCVCRLIVFEVCCVHICVCDDAHVYGGDICVWSLMCTYLYVNNIGKSTLKHGMHAGACKYVWSLLCTYYVQHSRVCLYYFYMITTTHVYSKSNVHIFICTHNVGTQGYARRWCVHACLKFTVHVFMCL